MLWFLFVRAEQKAVANGPLLSVPPRDPGFVERTLGRGEAEALEDLGGVFGALRDGGAQGHRPTCWEDCVHWARCRWESLFSNELRQLLHCFPADQVTTRRASDEAEESDGSHICRWFNATQG